MLLIDDRVGSNDLVPQLERLGLPVTMSRLDFGDVAFEGKGADEQPVWVGIELKKIGDLIGSLRSGRLNGHQAPGMLGPKGCYDHGWLLIEGGYKTDERGFVQTKSKRLGTWRTAPGGMRVSELEKRVLTLEVGVGLRVRHTPDRAASLLFLHNLYRWWTDTSLDRHASLWQAQALGTFIPMSDFRETVRRFPGVGVKASRAVEQAFDGNLQRACNASLQEWAAITVPNGRGKTKRLGLSTAERILAFIQGR